MASISTDAGGKRRILFVDGVGNRKVIRLGKVPMKTAATIKARVENILAAALGKHAIDGDTAAWVGDLDTKMHDKLAAVGLIPRREPKPKDKPHDVRLGDFLRQYIDGRTDIKPGTRLNLELVRRNLLAFFGPDKPLGAIAPGDADDFRVFLMERLAENTVRRNCGRAKQFFRAALRKRIIAENPFADLRGCGVQANASRFYYGTREEARKVLDACPDAQWRLLFALSRFGGLRCPSEHLGLRWGDVDWERGRFRVHSPKTEHHQGKESRLVPIFPELRPYLEAVFDEAEPGTEYVITRYRQQNANLRTQLERIIKRAGLQPWPKLFQNLRSTRETELVQEFPLHVVTAWLGNTAKIAAMHYLQVTDADFDRAVQGGAKSGAKSGALEAQNQAQQAAGDSGRLLQETTQAPENQGLVPEIANACNDVQTCIATPPGLEPGTREPKSLVLPLHHRVVGCRGRIHPASPSRAIILFSSARSDKATLTTH